MARLGAGDEVDDVVVKLNGMQEGNQESGEQGAQPSDRGGAKVRSGGKKGTSGLKAAELAVGSPVKRDVKVRCPHCGHVYHPEMKATCPGCGKYVMLPDEARDEDVVRKRRAKARIAREAERKRREFSVRPPLLFASRRYRSFLFAVALVLCVGGPLVFKPIPQEGLMKRQTPIMTAMSEVDAFAAALDAFRLDCGRYPTTQQGLKALVRNPGYRTWGGPYLNHLRLDPWKRPYFYVSTNVEECAVLSCGPDGAVGTEDDVKPDEVSVKDLLNSVPNDIRSRWDKVRDGLSDPAPGGATNRTADVRP